MTKKTKKTLVISGIVVAGAAVGIGCAVVIKKQHEKIKHIAKCYIEEEDKVCDALCFIYEKCGAEGVAELTGLPLEEIKDIFDNLQNP